MAKNIFKKEITSDYFILLVTLWYLVCAMAGAFTSYSFLSFTSFLLVTFIPFYFAPNLMMHCVIEAGGSNINGLRAKKFLRILCGFLGSLALILLKTVSINLSA
jgi:hypothetical protein